MGVADIVKTSTSVRIRFIASLCCTPNRCSSSTINSPRSLKLIPSWSSRCVPITQSTSPVLSWAITFFAFALVKNRDRTSTRMGYPAKRSLKVVPCCVASRVVGTSTATCLPSWMALNAALMATSVFPKPTSPHNSRSIGISCSISDLIFEIAVSWSGVSTNGNADSISDCHGVSGANA